MIHEIENTEHNLCICIQLGKCCSLEISLRAVLLYSRWDVGIVNEPFVTPFDPQGDFDLGLSGDQVGPYLGYLLYQDFRVLAEVPQETISQWCEGWHMSSVYSNTILLNCYLLVVVCKSVLLLSRNMTLLCPLSLSGHGNITLHHWPKIRWVQTAESPLEEGSVCFLFCVGKRLSAWKWQCFSQIQICHSRCQLSGFWRLAGFFFFIDIYFTLGRTQRFCCVCIA